MTLKKNSLLKVNEGEQFQGVSKKGLLCKLFFNTIKSST